MSSEPSPQLLLDIFLGKTKLIDVRAPIEFEKSHIPGSINLPILDNEQRAAVGLTYRKEGKEAATALGHQLVQGQLKDDRVAAWLAEIETAPCVITCARGGMRSAIAKEWVEQSGAEIQKVSGGYKAIRKFLSETLEQLSKVHPFIVVSGYTGCGKTDLLHKFKLAGLSVLDLEGLAHHRGSAFGSCIEPQPQQATFENAVAIQIIRLCSKSRDPIFVESESASIGRAWIPPCLYEAMQKSQSIILTSTMPERVQRIIDGYVLNRVDPTNCASFDELQKSLLESVDRIKKKLGGLKHQELTLLIEQAVQAHKAGGSPSVHDSWIRGILESYYDGFYAAHLEKSKDRTIVEGDLDKLLKFFTVVNHASSEITDDEMQQIAQLKNQESV